MKQAKKQEEIERNETILNIFLIHIPLPTGEMLRGQSLKC